MSTEKDSRPVRTSSLLRNSISLGGLIIAFGALFAFLLLFALDTLAPASNPYVGILTYLIAPGFLALGFLLTVSGALYQRWRNKKIKPATSRPLLSVDLSNPDERRNVIILSVIGVTFLLLTALGSYHTYHFTESVTFCGQACHTPMKPQFVTYQHSPHARVSCSECHVGPGATWYVKAKINGLHQVYSMFCDKFPRPIKMPISNLRPAQQTCEQCHWPEKFVGNLDRTYNHFLTDEMNTPYTLRMLLKVGGGDSTHGPVSGIHWHTSTDNKVEYLPADTENETIPWVRTTDPQGVVTEFQTSEFDGNVKEHLIRTMDCMDCHNRPAHIFKSPNEAVDLSLSLGRLDRSVPFIKKETVDILAKTYTSEKEALQGIATALNEKYPDIPQLKETISEVQRIFTQNFFPEMKADWRVYPNNIGHKDWMGCIRCHDDEHKTADGNRTIKASDCNTCHTILAEGSGEAISLLNLDGVDFSHPEEGWEDFNCNDCHTGANE